MVVRHGWQGMATPEAEPPRGSQAATSKGPSLLETVSGESWMKEWLGFAYEVG